LEIVHCRRRALELIESKIRGKIISGLETEKLRLHAGPDFGFLSALCSLVPSQANYVSK
jgi:hypothetical protein